VADPTEAVTALLEQLGQWKLQTIIAVAIASLGGYVLFLAHRVVEKYIDMRATERSEKTKIERAKLYAKSHEDLTIAVNKLVEAQEQNNALVADLGTTNKAVLATMRGVINPADSRKIIEAELWSVAKECVRAFQVSLRDNHFKGREDAIEKKMRRSVTKLLDRALKKLQGFDMAVKPHHFFSRMPDPLTYYLEESIWKSMVTLYQTPINYSKEKDAEFRDRVVYDSIMSIVRNELVRAHSRADDKDYIEDSGFYDPDPVSDEDTVSGFHKSIK
jgi:hypothetical protein